MENQLACLSLLLERGADPAAVDAAGNNALHAVAGQRERAGVRFAAVVERLHAAAPQVRPRARPGPVGGTALHRLHMGLPPPSLAARLTSAAQLTRCPALPCSPRTLPRPPPTVQLLTQRNKEFYLPLDRAPAGSALEKQLEALTRAALEAAAVAEEAARLERVRLESWPAGRGACAGAGSRRLCSGLCSGLGSGGWRGIASKRS